MTSADQHGDSPLQGVYARRQQPGGGRAPYLVVLACLLTTAGVVRWHHLHDVSYIFDEAFCWKLLSFGPHEIWHRAALDNHPPLYFYLLWCWSKLCGDSPEALRGMSVVFGTAAVAGAYLLAREIEKAEGGRQRAEDGSGELHAEWAGLMAAALVALSPLQIDWSQHVRMYSLGAALTALSSWLLLRATHAANARAATLGCYALAAVALIYTHYFGLLIVAGHALWTISRCGQKGTAVGAFAATFGLIALAWLPWLPAFLRHQSQVASGFWTPPLTWEQFARACYQTCAVSWRDPLGSQAGLAAALTLGVALPTAMFASRSAGLRLIGAAVLTTLAGALMGSLSGCSIVSPRYLIFAHLLLLCGVATAASAIDWHLVRVAAAGALLIACGALCWRHAERRDEMAARPGIAAAMQYLSTIRRTDEPIVVANPMMQIVAARYVPRSEPVRVLGAAHRFPYFQGTAVMRDEEYLTRARLEDGDARVIWVIDALKSTTGTWKVDLPHGWTDVAEETFAELGGSNSAIVVRRCLRRPSHGAASWRAT